MGKYGNMLNRGNIDMIRSKLAGIVVSRLNVIITLGLVGESISRLDTMSRSNLASKPVLRQNTSVNTAIK